MHRIALLMCCLLLPAPAFAQTAYQTKLDIDLCLYSSISRIARRPGFVIHACTEAIASGRLTKGNLAHAFMDRGIAWRYEGGYDLAIADFGTAIQLDPQYAAAYDNRGIAYRNEGKLNRAIADYSAAIQLNPQDPVAHNNRASALIAEGNYDEAIAEYKTAIRLDPKYAAPYQSLGWAQFLTGDYASAETNIARANQLRPNRYAILWLYLIRSREGSNARARLAADASAFSSTAAWPQPVIEYYLGRLSEPGLEAAAATEGAETPSEQRCEADFYLGEAQLLRHDAGAIRFFDLARATCPRNFYEYEGALAELKRIGK